MTFRTRTGVLFLGDTVAVGERQISLQIVEIKLLGQCLVFESSHNLFVLSICVLSFRFGVSIGNRCEICCFLCIGHFCDLTSTLEAVRIFSSLIINRLTCSAVLTPVYWC